jgi:hypothetical protein
VGIRKYEEHFRQGNNKVKCTELLTNYSMRESWDLWENYLNAKLGKNCCDLIYFSSEVEDISLAPMLSSSSRKLYLLGYFFLWYLVL